MVNPCDNVADMQMISIHVSVRKRPVPSVHKAFNSPPPPLFFVLNRKQFIRNIVEFR